MVLLVFLFPLSLLFAQSFCFLLFLSFLNLSKFLCFFIFILIPSCFFLILIVTLFTKERRKRRKKKLLLLLMLFEVVFTDENCFFLKRMKKIVFLNQKFYII